MKKNTSKELKEFLLIISVMMSIIIAQLFLDVETEGVIGTTFIFGLPMVLMFIGFIRGYKKKPIRLEVEGTKLIVYFIKNRSDELYLSNLRSINVVIHSRKTAFLEIDYITISGEVKVVRFFKKYHSNFTVPIKKLFERFSDECNCNVYLSDENGKNRIPYNLNEEWYDFLERKRSVKSLVDELKSESLLKKLGALLALGLMLIAKINASGVELIIISWMIGIGYLMYLITGAILRIKGYSRKESIYMFFSGMFFVFLGLGSVLIIVIELIRMFV